MHDKIDGGIILAKRIARHTRIGRRVSPCGLLQTKIGRGAPLGLLIADCVAPRGLARVQRFAVLAPFDGDGFFAAGFADQYGRVAQSSGLVTQLDLEVGRRCQRRLRSQPRN